MADDNQESQDVDFDMIEGGVDDDTHPVEVEIPDFHDAGADTVSLKDSPLSVDQATVEQDSGGTSQMDRIEKLFDKIMLANLEILEKLERSGRLG